MPQWATQPDKPAYTADEVGAEVAGAVSAHEADASAHAALFAAKLSLAGGTMTGQ